VRWFETDFWDYLPVPSSRVKISKKKHLDILSLEDETIGSPETSVSNTIRHVITQKTK
jgi:hypothetical protein